MSEIIQLFARPGKLALVGASNKPNSFGQAAYKELKDRGFTVYPVNPNYAEVAGDRCYKSISELPQGVESALFVLSPAAAEQAVEEARVAGIKRIWFQQGADYRAAVKAAQDSGMQVVSKKCILMYAPPVTGFHAFHRFLAKVFGRL
jgi:predicted CoA-binding protein